MKKNCLLWLLVAAMAMTSCQDEFIKNENKTSDKIGYAVETNSISEPLKSRASRSTDNTDVTIEELGQTLCGKQLYLHTITDMVVPMDIKQIKGKNQPQSRAAEKTVADIDEIGVTSIVWNGTSWENSGTERKLYMDNVEAEKPDFQTNYYWPAAEQRIRFFAYHPADAVSIANSDDKSTQTIQWTVPKVVANQHDLLVASSDEPADKKAEAPLFFGHALTAVQFKLSNEITGVTVTAVRIKGVKYKGTYTYDFDNHTTKIVDGKTYYLDAGTWEVNDGINDFEVSGLIDTAEDLFAEDRGEDKGIINYGVNTFMMMPQTLPDDATIEVDITDAHGSETLTASLKDKVWNKGTKVTYVLTFNGKDIVVSVDGDPRWSGAGGEINAGF